jgi:formiminoglutamate deiminase
MSATVVLEADRTWFRGRLESGLQVEVLEDGTIGRVEQGLSETPERLSGEILLPGFVNAHSHSFQRGLRGKAESSGTFWTWREEMYRLADALDFERFLELTKRSFREMLDSGITAVGEFHYLHHLDGSRGYELDEAVVEAARATGIRLVLLDACYISGDVGKPLEGAQLRFGSRSVEEFLKSAERLQDFLDPRTESLGLVAHSVRAVPIEAIAEIHESARKLGLAFHMHVEEQRQEIETSLAHYGKTPLALLLDRLEVGSEFTAVHCTHSGDPDLKRLLSTGANVCLCPLTEANLADGIAPALLSKEGFDLSLGTDSNLRIDFTEEMRLLEYAQRLSRERRGIFTDGTGSVASRLLRIATEGGARSLGLRAGRIETGYAADFLTLGAKASALADVPPEDLLTGFVLGAGKEAVRRVAVSGEWVMSRG